MSDVLNVANVEAQRGQKATGLASVPIGQTTVTVPIVVINGAQDGPRVAITAGVHGAEYVGIEAGRRLAAEIEPAQLKGSVVVVPIVNTTSFHRRSIYTSGLDDNNLNRMFPGKTDGEPSEVLARWIFETIIKPSQYYVDLHGGDMIEALVPFAIYLASDDKQVEGTARDMAIATGIPRVIKGLTPGSTYAAATAAGIPAVLSEIGGQGVWTDGEVEEHKEGALRVLRHLGVLEGEKPVPGAYSELDTFAWMRAGSDGLFHPSVQIGEKVTQGQPVGRVTDYFGNELESFTAVASGEVVFIVTSLAMNAGDPLLAIGA